MSIQSTSWTATASGPPAKASLQVSIDGGAAKDFSIKGVCYSPCPINGSNKDGPNLGDWFWDGFSGPGYNITGWDALWNRDFPNLKALGANTVRVYNMMSRQINEDGSYPQPWNSGHCFTHTKFLDACLNAGLYVVVGVALPAEMYWTVPPGSSPLPGMIDFWTNVLRETATQLGQHPAVLGFVVMNELDGGAVTYPPAPAKTVQYWWSQVQAMAEIVKKAAPTKLTGIAVHDDVLICGRAASQMAQCPAVDFWGVNSYQTKNLSSIFGATPDGPGYGGLTGTALKPVLITEWGMPATTRTKPTDPSTICQTDESIAATADVIKTVLPQAYNEQPLCIGLCYFEYCDEWWNQPGSPNKYTWWGGTADAGFPNGYWDQDGFGLYQTRPRAEPQPQPIWCVRDGGYNKGPCAPIDTVVERITTVETVRRLYGVST